MMRLTLTPCSLIIAVLLGNNLMFASSMSLHHTTVSDLPTPSFLIDMDMLYKASASIQTTPLPSSSSSPSEKNLEITYPCLSLPKHGKILVPHPQSINTARRIDSTDNDTPTPNKSNPPYDVSNFRGQSSLGYIHASVSVSKSCPVEKKRIREMAPFSQKLMYPMVSGGIYSWSWGLTTITRDLLEWGHSWKHREVTFRKQRWDDDGMKMKIRVSTIDECLWVR